MKINTLFRAMVIGLFITVASPAISNSIAGTEPATTTENQRAQQLMKRLEEIKAKNVDQLSRTEKKQLRKEVHAIKKELATISGGVYLSIGAIIIIILLLILLL
jgi:predicted PurR-regulated permease PerM